MSNGYRLELMPWTDDEIHLTYWDALHGEDVDLVLRRNGTVVLRGFDELADEFWEQPVNLVEELIKLSDKLYK